MSFLFVCLFVLLSQSLLRKSDLTDVALWVGLDLVPHFIFNDNIVYNKR